MCTRGFNTHITEAGKGQAGGEAQKSDRGREESEEVKTSCGEVWPPMEVVTSLVSASVWILFKSPRGDQDSVEILRAATAGNTSSKIYASCSVLFTHEMFVCVKCERAHGRSQVRTHNWFCWFLSSFLFRMVSNLGQLSLIGECSWTKRLTATRVDTCHVLVLSESENVSYACNSC